MRGRAAFPGIAAIAFLFLLLHAQPAPADEIAFGFRPVPPFVMEGKDGSFSGLEYEIIEQALSAAGHRLDPRVMPLARLLASYRAGELEAMAPVLPSTAGGGSLSEPYLAYDDVALVLASSPLRIGRPADLAGLSIAAFQTAKKALGEEFQNAVTGNPRYAEYASQVTQVRLLFSGRAQVIIGETRIFSYYIRDPATEVDPSTPLRVYRIFKPVDYRAIFSKPSWAADFNRGLAAIKRNGVYAALLAKYPALP